MTGNKSPDSLFFRQLLNTDSPALGHGLHDLVQERRPVRDLNLPALTVPGIIQIPDPQVHRQQIASCLQEMNVRQTGYEFQLIQLMIGQKNVAHAVHLQRAVPVGHHIDAAGYLNLLIMGELLPETRMNLIRNKRRQKVPPDLRDIPGLVRLQSCQIQQLAEHRPARCIVRLNQITLTHPLTMIDRTVDIIPGKIRRLLEIADTRGEVDQTVTHRCVDDIARRLDLLQLQQLIAVFDILDILIVEHIRDIHPHLRHPAHRAGPLDHIEAQQLRLSIINDDDLLLAARRCHAEDIPDDLIPGRIVGQASLPVFLGPVEQNTHVPLHALRPIIGRKDSRIRRRLRRAALLVGNLGPDGVLVELLPVFLFQPVLQVGHFAALAAQAEDIFRLTAYQIIKSLVRGEDINRTAGIHADDLFFPDIAQLCRPRAVQPETLGKFHRLIIRPQKIHDELADIQPGIVVDLLIQIAHSHDLHPGIVFLDMQQHLRNIPIDILVFIQDHQIIIEGNRLMQIVRLHDIRKAAADTCPHQLGIGEPMIVRHLAAPVADPALGIQLQQLVVRQVQNILRRAKRPAQSLNRRSLAGPDARIDQHIGAQGRPLHELLLLCG